MVDAAQTRAFSGTAVGITSVVLFLLAILLTGCGLFGGEPTETPIFEDGATVKLVCNNNCRSHGQCGVLASSGRDVVLAGRNTQRVDDHTAYYQNEIAAQVQRRQDRQVRYKNVENAESFSLLFYMVNDPAVAEGDSAWVASYCVESP